MTGRGRPTGTGGDTPGGETGTGAEARLPGAEPSPAGCPPLKPVVGYEVFEQLDIRTGTVREARPNRRARIPAYELVIDFGSLGERRSSARITARYAPEELLGRQVVAVVNFAPRRIAGVRSEVLVLGVVTGEGEVVLLHPGMPVGNGLPIA